MPPPIESVLCPRCREPSRKVGAATVTALSDVDTEAPGWRFCGTGDCDVVYFRADSTDLVPRARVRVPVFHKSDDPARLVCYCFSHTVAEVVADAGRSGSSDIAEQIAEKCRAGLDRCERMNPRGACCLGDVRALARDAGGAPGRDGSGCCADSAGDAPRRQIPLLDE